MKNTSYINEINNRVAEISVKHDSGNLELVVYSL